MLRLAVVFALAFGVLAGGSGCFFQEEFACVGGGSVRCGDDWCSGDCTLTYKKSCDKKVSYKLDCDLVDFCKPIKKACGDDGLYCGASEECITTEKCKLVKAHEAKHWFKGGRKVGGFIEVCEDVYTCADIDPWALDADAIEVVCKKEYEIVEDMDCDALFAKKSLWGGYAIGHSKFFKMNGFKCEDKLVGKLVCVEAEATIKGEICSDGIVCDSGYKCATKKECSKVPTLKPVCGKEPVYVCDASSHGASLCGNKVCSASQRCEIVTTKVCPGGVVLPVPGKVIPGTPGVIIPGTPGTIIPGTPGTIIPGTPGTIIPGTPGVIVVPGTPVPATPPPLTVDGVEVPAISVASSSFSSDDAVETATDVVANSDGIGEASAQSVNADGSFAESFSGAEDRNLVTLVDVNAAAGDEAVAFGDGQSNIVANDEATTVGGVLSDAFANDAGTDVVIDAVGTIGSSSTDSFGGATNAPGSASSVVATTNDDGANVSTLTDTTTAGQTATATGVAGLRG